MIRKGSFSNNAPEERRTLHILVNSLDRVSDNRWLTIPGEGSWRKPSLNQKRRQTNNRVVCAKTLLSKIRGNVLFVLKVAQVFNFELPFRASLYYYQIAMAVSSFINSGAKSIDGIHLMSGSL